MKGRGGRGKCRIIASIFRKVLNADMPAGSAADFRAFAYVSLRPGLPAEMLALSRQSKHNFTHIKILINLRSAECRIRFRFLQLSVRKK
jgi:hypothetical protein